MKNLIGRYGWVIALLAAAGGLMMVSFSTVSAEQSPFQELRRQMPAKLDLLRERVDEAGGKNVSLALLLASQDADARMVASTVLVYQQYPRERKLAVLLAAAVKYNQELSLMQRVEDKSLKQALAQAPEEMAGIDGMFMTVEKMLAMTPEQLKSAVAKAQEANMQRKAAEAVKRNVMHNLGQQNDAGKKRVEEE